MPSQRGPRAAPQVTSGRDRGLPDFVIIGAAKCGTTTLYRYLLRHPQIFLTSPKEPEFFSTKKKFTAGLEWYRTLFQEAQEGQLRGEASADYTRSHGEWPGVPARMAQTIPDARLIYLMRHPVERAYSWYGHKSKAGLHCRSFEEFLQQDPNAIGDSLYIRQIEEFLEHFSREQMHFILLSDLIDRSAETLDRLQRFLGLAPMDLVTEGPVHANRQGEVYTSQSLGRALHRLGRIPGLDWLRRLLGRRARHLIYRLLRSSPVATWIRWRYRHRLGPLSDAARQRLLKIFNEPTRELEEFLDQDLSHWKQ